MFGAVKASTTCSTQRTPTKMGGTPSDMQPQTAWRGHMSRRGSRGSKRRIPGRMAAMCADDRVSRWSGGMIADIGSLRVACQHLKCRPNGIRRLQPPATPVIEHVQDRYVALLCLTRENSRSLQHNVLPHVHTAHAMETAVVGQVVGPGACVVVDGPEGRERLVYHSADPAETALSRKLCIAPISWTASGPRCARRPLNVFADHR